MLRYSSRLFGQHVMKHDVMRTSLLKSAFSASSMIPQSRAERHAAKKVDNVWQVVLTGGPCAGKSTALEEIKESLAARGVRTFCVPEAATMLFVGGAQLRPGENEQEYFVLERTLLETQMSLEAAFVALAHASGEPSVVVCDRGMMDVKAYVEEGMWRRLLRAVGQSEHTLREDRYDMVVHMVTAADGAEQFYGTANNEARSESVEEAVAMDKKLQGAWLGHPRLHIVGNPRPDDALPPPFTRKVESCVKRLLELVEGQQEGEEGEGGEGAREQQPMKLKRVGVAWDGAVETGEFQGIGGLQWPEGTDFHDTSVTTHFLSPAGAPSQAVLVRTKSPQGVSFQSGIYRALGQASLQRLSPREYGRLLSLHLRDTPASSLRPPVFKRQRHFLHDKTLFTLQLHSLSREWHKASFCVLTFHCPVALQDPISFAPPFLRPFLRPLSPTESLELSSHGLSQSI